MVDPDLENPRIDMTAQKGPAWEELESFIKSDNEKELHNAIKKHGIATIWRPPTLKRNRTLLHMSAEFGRVKCIRRLVEAFMSSGLSVDTPDSEGESPLFYSIKDFQVEALKELLESKLHLNSRNDKGHTILHSLVYSISNSKDKESQEKYHSCLDMVLERPDIDLEAHNNSGYTPLFAAAMAHGGEVRRTNSQLSLCRKLLAKGASLEAQDGRGMTARQVFEERNVLTAVLMGERRPAPNRPFLSQLLDCLIMNAGVDQVKGLLNSQDQEDTNRAANSFIGSKTVLFYVVDKNDAEVAEALLDAGADPWKEQPDGSMSLHRCLSRGNPQILNLLIENMKTKRRLKYLDMKEESFSLVSNLLKNQHMSDKKLSHNYLTCLKRIFADDVLIDVNKMSGGATNKSILHVAATFNNQEALKMLIEKGAFIGTRKTEFGEDRGHILWALRAQTLEKAMDGCITHHPSGKNAENTENTLDLDYTLRLDYHFAVPPADHESKDEPPRRNEVETLLEISQNKIHRKAITHPLIQTLLYAKWCSVWPLYTINLLLYLGFVLLLTIFMYTLRDLRISEAKALQTSNSTLEEMVERDQRTVNILMAFLIPLTLYMLVREVFQIIYTRRTYLRNFENYLEWFLILFVFMLCIVNFGVDPTRHLAAWAMIIAWYQFVLLLGRVPALSIYVTMLRHVSWNFLKLIFLYGALILAFTVSFNIILQPIKMAEESETEFGNFWSTLPKAIVMATGEFEYSELSSSFLSSKVLFATSAILVFLLFLFLIFLVLMNVMNGLAVTDTQQVMEEATLYSLKSRLELVYLIEEMLRVAPCLAKILDRVQVITNPKKPYLLVKVNHAKKSERVTYGQDNEQTCKLNDTTAHMLRSHRIQLIAEEEERTRNDPTAQCLNILKELKNIVENRPNVLSQTTQFP